MDGAEGHGARVLPVLGHLVPDFIRRKGWLKSKTKFMLTPSKNKNCFFRSRNKATLVLFYYFPKILVHS